LHHFFAACSSPSGWSIATDRGSAQGRVAKAPMAYVPRVPGKKVDTPQSLNLG
jgi:hypothetical protein